MPKPAKKPLKDGRRVRSKAHLDRIELARVLQQLLIDVRALRLLEALGFITPELQKVRRTRMRALVLTRIKLRELTHPYKRRA